MKRKLSLLLSFFAIAIIFLTLSYYKNDNKDFIILNECKEIKPLEPSTKKSYEEFFKSLRLIKKITFKTYQYFTTLIANNILTAGYFEDNSMILFFLQYKLD